MMNVFMKNIFIEIIESSYGYGFSLKKLANNYFNKDGSKSLLYS